MNHYKKFGCLISVLGIVMLFLGAGVFTHRGTISPVVQDLGEFSVALWIPVLLLGLIIYLVGKFFGKRRSEY